MSKRFMDTSEDSISRYLKDVRKVDVLTPDMEVTLAKKIVDGDKQALDELVQSNLRFAISVAKEYQNQGLSLADLISEANLGLIKAAQRFDHTRGFRFISYAVWWVRQSILQSLNDNSRMIRLPVNITTQMAKIKREIDKFEQHNQRLPGQDEVENYSSILQPFCGSLNEVINEEGDELVNVIVNEDVVSPDADIFTDEILKEELDKTLSVLDDREKDIIMMYFGINGHNMTLEQIGDEYSLTKERIRQIKERALRKLKNNCDNLFQFIYK